MIRKFSKLLVTLFIILTIISCFSVCLADKAQNTTITTGETAETKTEEIPTESEEDIHKGDLYLLDNNITMDKLVDGNVYIIGNNITISGQINGNLFILGNNIKFDNCYVRYSIYACGNDIYYNGACNDLYAMTEKLEMTYDSYVIRDVKAGTNSAIFKAAVGRDVDLDTNTVDFGADKEVPAIYGNLRYSANEEIQLADGIVTGEVIYSKSNLNQSTQGNILDILLAFILAIVTSLVIFALLHKFKPNCVEKFNFTLVEIVKALGFGILTVISFSLVTILLLITSVGAKLGFIVLLTLILLGLFATPIVCITITNLLKPILKIEKALMYYIVLALISVILYGLTLIPFGVGGFISILITLLGYGFIVISLLPKKELSEEEIQKRLQLKEQKRVLKEEKKAQRAQLKEAKKAEKESKKNSDIENL